MKNKRSLLLIDDEPIVLETLGFWLEDEGYEIHTANCRAGALEILGKHPVDVCLIDMMLGDEDGLEVSQDIKRYNNKVKNIILTACPGYQSAAEAMKMGIFDYVSKAADSKEILGKIEEAVQARLAEAAMDECACGDREKIILLCDNVMVHEGFEAFCRKYPQYCLVPKCHSISDIGLRSINFKDETPLVLICCTCNHNYFNNPERLMAELERLLPQSRGLIINCDMPDYQKLKMLKLGIRGFLPRDISAEDMHKAFQTVADGEMWISRELNQLLLARMNRAGEGELRGKLLNIYNLSAREIEILEVTAESSCNLEAGRKLDIRLKTVKSHLYNIYKKMRVKSRDEAVMKARDEGII